jgi:hypothetical protein
VDLQVLKAIALILGVQVIIWIFGMAFFSFYFNFISLSSIDQIGFFEIVLISGIISSAVKALEVPILYFTRLNFLTIFKFILFFH